MHTRLMKLRFRRRLRKGQQQVEDLGVQAEQQIDQLLLKRFDRLLPVRRFVIGWLGLVLLLIAGLIGQNLLLSGYYQTLRPVPGGIYEEGVLGRFSNANPIFANNDADLTVSRLIFAGLFKFNDQGKLVGDLAQNYTTNEQGSVYTVRLKPHLTWQDGTPLTSADVVYTYQAIQNPDARSPLQSSWQGIQVTAPNARTVVFTLPGGLASFANTMTNGIVPKHLLASIPFSDLRSAEFNTVRPVGAGPFAWQAIKVSSNANPQRAEQQIALTPFPDYQGGQPKLHQFVVHIFAADSDLIDTFRQKQLTAVEGLSTVPKALENKKGVVQYNLPLRAATMVFFKTTSGVLAEAPVRQALVQAADVPAIIKQLDYPAHPVREPFLAGQLGYDPTLVQSPHDLKAAKATLEAAGWRVGKGGNRFKDKQKLTFSLTVANTPENHRVAELLRQQWRQAGATVDVLYLGAVDFQNTLTYHGYDAVLHGISIGSDPDVFVYWDSSQADIRSANRLNLSEYKNTTADTALEAGRTRLDPTLRIIKYKPFLQAWHQDNPALGLYQPRLLYLANDTVAGLNEQPINTPTDRFRNVENWMIRQARVTN